MSAYDRDLLTHIRSLEARIADLERIEIGERVLARATRTTSAIVAGDVQVRLDYDTIVYDTHGAITVGGDWRYSAPLSGFYRIAASVLLNPSVQWDTAGDRIVQIYLMTSASSDPYAVIGRIARHAIGNDCYAYVSGHDIVYLNAGNTVYADVLQTSGATQDIYGGTNAALYNTIKIERLNK